MLKRMPLLAAMMLAACQSQAPAPVRLPAQPAPTPAAPLTSSRPALAPTPAPVSAPTPASAPAALAPAPGAPAPGVPAPGALAPAGNTSSVPTNVASSAPAYGEFGIDTVQMDVSIRPGDDFYKYVNGKWLASFKIPADAATYAVFTDLRDKADDNVRTLLELLVANPSPAGSTKRKIADLYASFQDEQTVEARGLSPILPMLAAIEGMENRGQLMRFAVGTTDFSANQSFVRSSMRMGPIGASIGPHPEHPDRYAVFIGQAGLNMPNRDYYLKTGPAFDKYRAAYSSYVTRVFTLMGDREPIKSAAAVLALETRIAGGHWTAERRRIVKDVINPMSVKDLQKLAPDVDWASALYSAGLGGVQEVVVRETTAVREGAHLLRTEPLEDWKKYLEFSLVNDNTALLPKAFGEASFDFYGRALTGQEKQAERWKRGVDLLGHTMGMGVGEAYVAKYFPPETKAKVDAMVANLRAAMGERLKALTWMDEPTRAEALKKLAAFDPRVGYPTHWIDYSRLAIDRAKLFESANAARQFEWDREAARLNQPVDRSEWTMTPQTVNAYYSSSTNQITFPAAILQPPFFDPNADPAVNYGAIGSVIGHEMGHGFDDQGREYDGSGMVRNWWTPETDARFKAQTDRLAAQYDKYCLVKDACVNGRLTMGENIGDLGGLEMAFTAYHLSLGGKEAPVIGGFTSDQRFFMAQAQIYRQVQRDDAYRRQVTTDPHSPGPVRGTNPERNIDAWYSAFNVQPGEKLYLPPDQRVHIW